MLEAWWLCVPVVFWSLMKAWELSRPSQGGEAARKLGTQWITLGSAGGSFVPAGYQTATQRPQGTVAGVVRPPRGRIVMGGKENGLRTRIASVTNTRKITEAMRLVAAAKVRKAQQAVLATRPFSETLQSVLSGLIERLESEDVNLPLLESREVRKVTVVLMAGDRGLCGGYNSYAIKKAKARLTELAVQGVEAELVLIGQKGLVYYGSRDTPVVKSYQMGQVPTAKEANDISKYLLSSFLSGDTDSVEIIYTQFVSLIASSPCIRTLLPLSRTGIEMEGDEAFQLTTKNGEFAVEQEFGRDAMPAAEFPPDMILEQDLVELLNAILPLYINGQILRMMQESVASELASRMQAMQTASDNAKNLKSDLSREYNRARQASVTAEILEIVAGADASAV